MAVTLEKEIYETLIPHIDREKCCGDAICAKACVRGCIVMDKENKALYKPLAFDCFQCGHCIALCPKDAISFDHVNIDALKVEKPIVDVKELTKLYQMRRSVRIYKEEKVDEKLLMDALNAAVFAPTGKNMQDVSWVLVNDRKKIDAISLLTVEAFANSNNAQAATLGKAMLTALKKGRDKIAYNAPQMIFAYAPKESSHAIINTNIAMSYLEILLASMDVGTCWAGYVNTAASMEPKIHKILALPENSTIGASMLVGYSKVKYRKTVMRKALSVHTI